MYALARNTWKFRNRDNRIHKLQNIEFETFAPDTIEEVITGRRLLEIWTAKAYLRSVEKESSVNESDLIRIGKDLLSNGGDKVRGLEVLGENMENSHRKVLLLKVFEAHGAYNDMLFYYSMKNLMMYFDSNPGSDLDSMYKELHGMYEKEWVNLGGQIMLRDDIDKLRKDIGSGKINSWHEIHERYNALWKRYPVDKQKHSYSILCELYDTTKIDAEKWNNALERFMAIQHYISSQVYTSRKKDLDNPFKHTTFRNKEEFRAALGSIDENSFILQVRQETVDLEKKLAGLKFRN